jgi:uncharacterized protein (TIGR03086 family)
MLVTVHPVAEALVAALDVQVGVGRQVRAEQLGLGSPCPGWSVHDVINHSLGVTLKFAGFAAGRTDRPRAPTGDLVGRDHARALAEAAGAARVAWASADLTRQCHLPFGTFPADLAAGINLFDVLAHTWDVATATGTELWCDDELWIAGLDAARAVIGPGRDPRQYAAEITTGPDASPRRRFLGFLGRAGEKMEDRPPAPISDGQPLPYHPATGGGRRNVPH